MAGGVIAVRVKPGAARARVGGVHHGPHGPALVVAVRERAAEGRATEAACRAVARALGLRPSAVTLRQGARSRDKLFTVAGDDPDRVAAQVQALRGGRP